MPQDLVKKYLDDKAKNEADPNYLGPVSENIRDAQARYDKYKYLRDENDNRPVTNRQITSGPQIKLENIGNLSGSYDQHVLKSVIDAAKDAGVDPMTALAIAGQESTFGKYWGNFAKTNPMHNNNMENNRTIWDARVPPEDYRDNANYFGMKTFKAKYDRQMQKTPGDEAAAIQTYNGMGQIPSNPFGDKMYGKDVNDPSKPLLGWRDKPYGQRILEIKERLRQNPVINSLINYGSASPASQEK